MTDLLNNIYNTAMSGFWPFVGTMMLAALVVKGIVLSIAAARGKVVAVMGDKDDDD